MPVKIIVFDIDGVVISSKMFSVQLEKDYGISRELLHPFFRGVFQKCLVGEADLREEIASYCREWGWKGSPDELLAYWFRVEGKIDEKVLDFIAQAKNSGKICYAATNQEKYRTDYLRDNMGLGNIFSHVFSSACLGCKKPDEVFYNKVFASISNGLNIGKDEIMFIDDDAKNIEAAKNFGFQIIHYKKFEDININLFNN